MVIWRAVLHATNRGSNAGDDFACNTQTYVFARMGLPPLTDNRRSVLYKLYAESFRDTAHPKKIQQEANETIGRIFNQAPG